VNVIYTEIALILTNNKKISILYSLALLKLKSTSYQSIMVPLAEKAH